MGKNYNRPTAQLVKATYASPPDPQNPVLRGLPLYYSSMLISSSSLLSRYLWGTAGFITLRNLEELNDYTPRYDPTVCPISDDADQSDTSNLQVELEASRVLAKIGQTYPSVADYAAAYKSGSITPSAVVEVLIPLIGRDAKSKSQHSTAFLQIKADEVRASAEASTKRWSSGTQFGPLDGVPVAVKDEVDIAGYRKCLGSGRSFKVRGTSWCVEKLIEAGAIVLGKSTMHELGLDTSGNNPIHGTPCNPYNDSYYCGGSSSGSAYSVAAGLVPLAVGADGGGSIRIPASFCGVYGLKATHGRVSKRPTPNDAASNSVVGPIGATMLDIEAGFRVMAIPDPDDATSSSFPASTAASDLPKERILGIYKPWFDRAPASVCDPCYAAIDYLRDKLDYRVIDIAIPHLHAGQLAHAMTALTEIAAVHPSTAGLVPPSKILLSVGRQTPAADFLLAQRLRALLMQHLSALFAQHPGLVVVSPTSGIAGWPIAGGETELRYGASDANTSSSNMEFVWLANFCGCPALQAPVGYVDGVLGEGKVPVGIMGMTEWGADEPLIGWGYDVEKWLHEGREEGRLQPPNWVDVLAMAKEKGSA